MQPFRPFADKPMTMRYYEVGADLLEDRMQLLDWARKSIAAARRDPPKPQRKRTNEAKRKRANEAQRKRSDKPARKR